MNDAERFVMRSLGSGKRRVKQLRRDMVNVTRCSYSESKNVLEAMHDSDNVPVSLEKRSGEDDEPVLYARRTDLP